VPSIKATHVEVYVFCRRPNFGLLLLRRSRRDSLPGIWQPITGRIDRRESALAAAAREVREETGLSPRRWWRLEQVVSYVDPPSDELRVVPLFAAEVADRSRVQLSAEHDAHRWVTLAAAGPLVLWDTQRAALQAFRRQVLRSAKLSAALEIHLRNAARPTTGVRRKRAARRARRTRG
jgi:dATP pyrophosphohydrolase